MPCIIVLRIKHFNKDGNMTEVPAGQVVKLEYVWVDGFRPWGLRSKVKVDKFNEESLMRLDAGDARYAPEWGFDGSSTGQSAGADSDCILKPAAVFLDTVGVSDYVVLCEVLEGDGTPHRTNNRAELKKLAEKLESHDAWFGLEQEYTIVDEDRPLGFPPGGFPAPQGIYYCSAGGDRAFGRAISDAHLQACIDAGLDVTGTNAEVMPGQWEFQIGGPGVGPISVSDQLWVARWFLLKAAEAFNLTVTFEPKPMLGDWNGAGCHANFSTKSMRADGGLDVIQEACEKLSKNIQVHLDAYGEGIERRLTGEHETCSYKEFKWGIADRTASIRIPRPVATAKKGYLEDRRPNANCDPYNVTAVMLKTCCE